MRTSVWLVRHGQTFFNRERRYQSVSDSPLTAYGQQQITALARRLRQIPFSVGLVSPTGRTQATANAILAGRDGVLPVPAPEWAETHHGRWEGLTYREVMGRFPEEARARWVQGIHGKAMGGESLAEVAGRVSVAWNNLLRHYPGGRILIVSHATPIQLVLCATFDLPPDMHWHWRIDLGSVTSLDIYPSGTIVRMVNEIPRFGFKPDNKE